MSLLIDRQNLALILGATLVTWMLPGSASAKYTAIDQSGDQNVFNYYGGYCDALGGGTNLGSECGLTYTLPYAVTFGSQTTNQLSVRNDGKLVFAGAPVAPPPGIDLLNPPTEFDDDPNSDTDPFDLYSAYIRNQFEVLALVDTGIGDSFNSFISGQLASVLGPPYYLAQEITLNFPGALTPEANYFLTNPVIQVSWFFCDNPQDLSVCPGDLHTVTLTPGARGFDVSFGGINDKAGYLLEARIDPLPGVPEPRAWALLLMGFGAMGGLLRLRRKGALGTA